MISAPAAGIETLSVVIGAWRRGTQAEAESEGGMSAKSKHHWNQRIMGEMVHVRWYLRFRRFKEDALDLRRSSNMRRSLYVAASWSGWKDPLGIVGGVDLGGMAFETGARTSGRTGPKVGSSVRSPPSSSSWGGEGGRRGRCGRLSRRMVVIRGHHAPISRLCSSRGWVTTPKTPEKLDAVHGPGNTRGGGSLRYSRRGL